VKPLIVTIWQICGHHKDGVFHPGLLPLKPHVIEHWVEQGLFPKPIKLGSKVSGWKMSDIEDWIEQKQQKG